MNDQRNDGAGLPEAAADAARLPALGLETAEEPLLPIIIITARANQLFVALGAGAGALMEKPLDLPRLLQTIRDLLDEPAEMRLARLTGKRAEFHYLPPKAEVAK